MNTIKGTKVSDKALGQKKHSQEPMILNVDKRTVSNNVQEVLKLHPKHALPVPVKLIEVKTEIQKGFYKQRLSMKREEERIEAGETEEEAEKNDAEAHKLIDKESKPSTATTLDLQISQAPHQLLTTKLRFKWQP